MADLELSERSLRPELAFNADCRGSSRSREPIPGLSLVPVDATTLGAWTSATIAADAFAIGRASRAKPLRRPLSDTPRGDSSTSVLAPGEREAVIVPLDRILRRASSDASHPSGNLTARASVGDAPLTDAEREALTLLVRVAVRDLLASR
jgi:hypothetical protein